MSEPSLSQPSTAECAALLACLQAAVPELPSRYFYDDRGSALFEEITTLAEYYQTRTEVAILAEHADRIMGESAPRQLVELGSGAGHKIRLLLDAGLRQGELVRCTMLDVNELFLQQSVATLSHSYPQLKFEALLGDFTADLHLLGAGDRRLVLFLAGTIGNLYPGQRQQFLSTLAGQMTAQDRLLIGIDLIKDPARLEAAYNDAAGVTAAFNRNILSAVNQRFGADFVPEKFAHRAFYDRENSWIEMRLVAQQAMVVRVAALNEMLHFAAGDELRTEISCKFSPASFTAISEGAGLCVRTILSDREGLFAQVLLGRAADA